MRIKIFLAFLFVSASLGLFPPDARAGETQQFIQRFVLVSTILVPTKVCPRDPGPYQSECIRHVIFKGDMLGSIARYYGTSEQKLKQFNPWVRGMEQNLPIGETLIIPKIIAENRIIAEYKKENEALGKDNEEMKEEIRRLQEDLGKRDADFHRVNSKNIEIAIKYLRLEKQNQTNRQRISKLREERDMYVGVFSATLYSVATLEGERMALEEKLEEAYARVKEADARAKYWQNEFEKQKAALATLEQKYLLQEAPTATIAVPR